jgi:outer membrane protein
VKNVMAFFVVILFSYYQVANASNLLQVYQQAQSFDPTFQKAVAQRLSVKEGVPISLSALLPNLTASANPSIARTGNAGVNYISPLLYPRNITSPAYTLSLSVTQTVFDFAQFFNLSSEISKSKSADATLNAALQDLMFRVANAYFTILKDEENLLYSAQSKQAYAKQLEQIQMQFKARISTITDVDTAKASYDYSVSNYIGALNTLENDREVLREMTNVYYTHLSPFNKHFPVVTPQPENINKWVEVALRQNWSIKAAQYKMQSALEVVKQQFSGHLPTVSLQGSVTRQYTSNINRYPSSNTPQGTGIISDREIGLNINLPLYTGGQVTAQTNQARYNYEVAQQELTQTDQAVITKARQSYNSMMYAVSRINADIRAVAANQRSVHGMEISFNVGILSLIDILNQQQKLYQSQTQYAADRYEYIKNMVALKQAAGTLSFNDLRAINSWLT